MLKPYMPRIMIASAVRQDAATLHYFLQSLHHLDLSFARTSFHFIDDNVDLSAKVLLLQFAEQCEDPVDIIPSANIVGHDAAAIIGNKPSNKDHPFYWDEATIRKVARFKNWLLEQAIAKHVDALFLVDADLMLQRYTLTMLHGVRRDIVSEIFWTRWDSYDEPMPQVWQTDEYAMVESPLINQLNAEEQQNHRLQFLQMLQYPGIYPVGGLGGCTMIRIDAMKTGINFNPIRNLSFQREDRHFSVRAAVIGLEVYVDTHFPAYHIYRQSDLQGADQWAKTHYE